MNKKGFTLVELISAISIMLLITIISVPAVISLLSKSDEKYNETIKSQLISYAKTYMKDNEHINNLEEGYLYCVLVKDLTDENFTDYNNNEIKGRIEIRKNGDKLEYTYSEQNDSIDCDAFPEKIIIPNDEEIKLSINENPEFDQDSLLGYYLKDEYYSVCPPSFNKKFISQYEDYSLCETFDKNGKTYYFRGDNNLKNYIKFEGDDTLFQILRFNSNGTIRIVSTEPIKNGNEPTKIQYKGVYYEYRDTYKFVENQITEKMGADDFDDYEDIKVYNSITLSDKFNKDSKVYVQDTTYPTLKDCFSASSNDVCKDKYIALNLVGKNTDVNIWNMFSYLNSYTSNMYKIDTTYIPNSYYSCSATYFSECHYMVELSRKLTVEKDSRKMWYSDLYLELEKWYIDNYKHYENYLERSNFCINDGFVVSSDVLETLSALVDTAGGNGFISKLYDSVSRLSNEDDNVQPSLICYNEIYNVVGTLTADDVIFAGGTSIPFGLLIHSTYLDFEAIIENLQNKSFFLYRDGGYLTLTNSFEGYPTVDTVYNPFTYSKGIPELSNNIYQFYTNEDIQTLIHSDLPAPVYPVLNVKGDIKFTGSGSKEDPIVIKTS